MNLRLGIYEIFSRIVPGGIYLIAILQFLVIVDLVHIDWQTINNISLVVSLALIVICYILGEAFDRIAMVWLRLFRKRGFSNRAFAKYKARYDDRWEINLKDNEWRILWAHIRIKDIELADEIDRHNALSIMLRNASFGLLLMTINSLIFSVVSRNIIYVVIGVIVFLISILIIRESTKFREWFLNEIFETTIAYRVTLEEIIKPVRSLPKRGKNNSGQ